MERRSVKLACGPYFPGHQSPTIQPPTFAGPCAMQFSQALALRLRILTLRGHRTEVNPRTDRQYFSISSKLLPLVSGTRAKKKIVAARQMAA